MEFEARPLDGEIGAEVIGLDLDREIDTATAAALNELWLDAAILLFRGIGTSNERHLRLSRVFGELEVHPIPSLRLEGHPEIIYLAQKKGDRDQMTHPKAAKGLIAAAKEHGKTFSVKTVPVGHHEMTEAPDTTLQHLRDFLQT